MNHGLISNVSDLLNRFEVQAEADHKTDLAMQEQKDIEQNAMLEFCSNGV